MKRIPIAEICAVNPRLPTSLSSQRDREVDFVPMASLGEDGRINVNGTRKLGEVVKGYTYFENGDVLVAKITPCLENGKAAYVQGLPHEIGFGSTEFHVLRANSAVDPRYLFYMVWNTHFRREASRSMTGTAGQQRAPASFFERYEIPLPPLREQKRIASILDHVDALRRKRQLAVAEVSDAVKGFFLSAFGHPRSNPKHFRTLPLGDVSSVDRGKFTPRPRNDPRFYGGKYPFIQTGDISASGGIVRSWNQTLNEEGRAISRSFPERTVVIAIVGATIGETAILAREMYCPDSVVGIRPFANVATPEYVEFLLRFFKQSFRDMAPETARANINLETLRPLMIPTPPIERQREFSRVCNLANQLTTKMGTSLTHMDDLFESLVQRAFRGEL